MLSIALSIVLANTQDVNITFQSNFQPLGTVVERLAGATRTRMAAFGTLKGYPIYINVKDVPLKKLMDKIAEVSGAEWERRDESWYLIASQPLRIMQERTGDADLIAAIDASINVPLKPGKSIADLAALMNPKEAPDRPTDKSGDRPGESAMPPAQDTKGMMAGMAELIGAMRYPDQLTMDLLKVIGAKGLSSIAEGRRVVLSNRPTQMQALLPQKAFTALLSAIKAAAIKAESASGSSKLKSKSSPKNSTPSTKQAGQGAEPDENDGSGMFSGEDMFSGIFTGMLNIESAKNIETIAACFQMSNRKNLNVSIQGYNKAGVIGYSRTVDISVANPEELRERVKGTTKIDAGSSAALYAKTLVDARKVDPLVSMVLSAQLNPTAIFSTLFGGADDSPPTTLPKLPIELSSQLAKPSVYEPMGIMLGPVLEMEAARGQNVVALPSDEVFSVLSQALNVSDPTLEQVMDDIDRSLSQEVTKDGTWTIVQASSPLEVRSAFCNRVALEVLLTSGLAKGYLNLEDNARFATAQGTSRGAEILALPLVSAVLRTSDVGSAAALSPAGFDGLKFYATLSAEHRAALAAKRPIAVASLTPNQLQLLGQMMFNGVLPPVKSGGAGMDLGSIMMQQMDSGSDNQGAEESESGDAAMGMMMMGAMMGSGLGTMFGMGNPGMDAERTFLLPSGVPVTGSVKMNKLATSALYAQDTLTNMSSIIMPEMLAMPKDMQEMGMFKSFKTDYDRFFMASQKTLMISFSFKNANYFTTLYDVTVDKSKSYTKADLPKKIKDRMDRSSETAAPDRATVTGKSNSGGGSR